MDLGLAGKSVLVTGGSKGISLACARTFVAEGCGVHLAAVGSFSALMDDQERDASSTRIVQSSPPWRQVRRPTSTRNSQYCGAMRPM